MGALTKGKAQVALPTRIGFGVGDFGFLLVWQGTSLFLLYFYTDVIGIDPFIAGAIYLAAMVWDAISDPIIATLAERSNSRWGKYRPWIFLGAIPFGISYILAFSLPPSSAIAPWLWALITHLLLRTAYTVVSMPFNAMQARLTSDADERSVLAGFRMIGAAMGALTIVALTPMIVQAMAGDGEAAGYFWAACLAGGLASLGLLYCAATMKEPKDAPESDTSESFFADLAGMVPLILKNGPLLTVLGVIVIGSVCLGMFGSNILYHFKYDVERPELITPALVVPAILLFLAAPFWVWVSTRLSKRDTLRIGLGISLVGFVGFFLNPSSFIFGSFAFIVLIGLGTAAFGVMFWSMLPDTIDHGELITGQRAEARTFGVTTLAQKAAVGINALVLGGLLSLSGFEANTDQSEGTLLAIKAIMALFPAVGVVVILWIVRGYPLDSAKHNEILAALGR